LGRNPGFRLLDTSWNPVGRLDIFRAESGKLLDLGPVQVPVGAFTLTYDGDAFTGFPPTSSDWPTDEDRRRFHEPVPHDRYIQATPYLWHPKASVLVIGVGGGADMRVAQLEGASSVDGVEINRSTIDAMTRRFAEDSGRIYLRPNTRIFAGDGRSFLM